MKEVSYEETHRYGYRVLCARFSAYRRSPSANDTRIWHYPRADDNHPAYATRIRTDGHQIVHNDGE
jgi:hypothetical protein